MLVGAHVLALAEEAQVELRHRRLETVRILKNDPDAVRRLDEQLVAEDVRLSRADRFEETFVADPPHRRPLPVLREHGDRDGIVAPGADHRSFGGRPDPEDRVGLRLAQREEPRELVGLQLPLRRSGGARGLGDRSGRFVLELQERRGHGVVLNRDERSGAGSFRADSLRIRGDNPSATPRARIGSETMDRSWRA
jgi:hypothetical protein